VAPAVIGLILGPVAETNLRRALAIGEGNPAVLVQSPFSVVVYLAALLAVFLPPLVRRIRSRRPERAEVSTR
jgi:putative tricarboxylic transport membrane protein